MAPLHHCTYMLCKLYNSQFRNAVNHHWFCRLRFEVRYQKFIQTSRFAEMQTACSSPARSLAAGSASILAPVRTPWLADWTSKRHLPHSGNCCNHKGIIYIHNGSAERLPDARASCSYAYQHGLHNDYQYLRPCRVILFPPPSL